MNKLTPELLEILIPIIQSLHTGEIKTDMRTFIKLNAISISLIGLDVDEENRTDMLCECYVLIKSIEYSRKKIINIGTAMLVRNEFDADKTLKETEKLYYDGLHEIIEVIKQFLTQKIPLFNIKEFQMN